MTLETLEPLRVDPDEAEDVRRERVVRVEAPTFGHHVDSPQPEPLDGRRLSRQRLSMEPDEGLTARESGAELAHRHPERGGQQRQARLLTGELARTDVDRGHLQRERENLAVAIDHRAPGRDERDTLAVLQVGEMREGRSPQHREVDGAREDEEEEAGDDPRDHERARPRVGQQGHGR